jgi:hypothetical protein
MKNVVNLKLVLASTTLVMLGLGIESGRAQEPAITARFTTAMQALNADSLLSGGSDGATDNVVKFQPPQLNGEESSAWINKTNAALSSAIRGILQNKPLQDQYSKKEREVLVNVSAEQAGSMTILVRSVFIQRMLGR